MTGREYYSWRVRELFKPMIVLTGVVFGLYVAMRYNMHLLTVEDVLYGIPLTLLAAWLISEARAMSDAKDYEHRHEIEQLRKE